MGIDGIGKPPGSNIPGTSPVSGTSPAHGAEPFKVERSDSTSTAPAAAPAKASEALGGLQRGEISLDQYLDTRVNEATSHLSGKLSPDQLEFVKQSLREQMATDPVLVELVQRTTGSVPTTELR
jgi:hypothetical protein